MSKINPPDSAMDEYMVSPPPPPPPPPPPHEGGIGQKVFSLVSKLAKRMSLLLFALVFLTGGLAFYFYRQLSALESNPQIQAQRETASLVAQISKIFLLPTHETPTIATVLDPAGLKGQAFFLNATKGDKVLIYGNAREAILYDPGANKVINVAPLVIGNSQTNSAPPAPVSDNAPPTAFTPGSSTASGNPVSPKTHQ